MQSGSCLCGSVQFEFDSEIREFHHCHCKTCRKAHATVFGSSALVNASAFRVRSGKDMISEYSSSAGKIRYFCSNCGTHVFARGDQVPDDVILRIGALDGDIGMKAYGHIWVSHKPDWYDIGDELPQYSEWSPKRIRSKQQPKK